MQLMMEEEMQKKATIQFYRERECVIQSALTRLCYEQDLQDLDNFAHISSYPAHWRATKQWRTCWPPRGGRSRS